MEYNFCKLVIGFATITPVLAAFKDFVIKNERDLQSFGVVNEDVTQHDEMMYDELFYEDFKGIEELNAITSKCEINGDLSRNYKKCVEDLMKTDDLSIYEDKIDERFFTEIIRQLANKPDAQNIQIYLRGY